MPLEVEIPMSLFSIVTEALLIVGFLVLLLNTLFTVNQQSVEIVQRLGKFIKICGAGLNFKIPFIDSVVAHVDLRVSQLDVVVETKTKDNVFVKVMTTVQYFVIPDRVTEAFYSLQNSTGQIKAFIFDLIRAEVPKMNLDDVFEKKDHIAVEIKKSLTDVMGKYGYGIGQALVTDVVPDERVKDAMNEINAAQRLMEAAKAKGEAEKIVKIKQAEAEAESKKLQGIGIADQRKAIINGLKESVETFEKSVPGATAQDVMALVLTTQYFDTLKEIGMAPNVHTIMLPHSPGGLKDISAQIRDSMISASEVTNGNGRGK